MLVTISACAAPAPAIPTETPAPTKFAIALPTSTPTTTPTLTPSPTATPTRTRTFTPIATRKPASTATPLPSPTLTPSPTPMLIPGETYALLSVIGSRAPQKSSDVNLSARGYITTTAQLALIDIDGPADSAAPQLYRLFSDHRIPTFTAAYQFLDGGEYAVSLIGIAANAGEILRVPDSGYNLGDGFEVLVTHADADRIVLNYTREGDAVRGYALYLEGVMVDANLVALYQQANNAGRGQLPALRAGQGFARVKENNFKLAIRDAGAFMDPRSRKDWWRR